MKVKKKTLKRYLGGLLLLSLTGILTACGSSSSGSTPLIQKLVAATTGGVFVDSDTDPKIRIIVPEGALSADANLKVTPVSNPDPTGANQAAASSAFKIEFTPASGSTPVSLNTPMRLEFKTDDAPIHPQIGEIAAFADGKWVRMPANFFRTSDSTTVALSKRTSNTFQVVNRSLQTEQDTDAVERGRDLYFNGTYGNEAFFGGLYKVHELLNNPIMTPNLAAGLGMGININKVPQSIIDVLVGDDFSAKRAAMDSHDTTIALLKADAIIGVEPFFDDPENPDKVTNAGLHCTICHVAVTTTPIVMVEGEAPVPLPVGQPIIGPPNTRINAGVILGSTPFVQDPNGPEFSKINSDYFFWGPGRADPRFFPGNPFNDNVTNPTSIPPHWNFIDLGEQGYTYTWQGVIQGRGAGHDNLAAAPECGIDFVMNANGAWGTPAATISLDPTEDIGNPLTEAQSQRFIDAENDEPGNDITRETLTDLQAFLRSLVSPAPGEFNEAKAEQGWELFYGKANCDSCHNTAEGTASKDVSPRFFNRIAKDQDPGGLLNNGIKVPGLRGLTHTAPYFHDGSAATLLDVMVRYSSGVPSVPTLSADEQGALVEYMKSL